MQFKDVGSLFSSFGDLSGKRFGKNDTFDNLDTVLQRSFNDSFKVGADGISEFTTAEIQAKSKVLGLNESLTQQALSLAQDATLSAKAATGKLTFKKAIEQNITDAGDLVDALENSNSEISKRFKNGDIFKIIEESGKKGSTEYNNFVKQLIEKNEDLAESFVELPASAGKTTGFFSSISTYAKGLIGTLKTLAPLLVVVGTAFAAYKGFKWLDNKYNLTYDTNLSNVKDHVTNLQNAKAEIDSLNEKADQYKQTLQEIASNYDITLEGTESVDEMINKIRSANGIQLSLVDQAEIDKIKIGNDELERTLEIKQRILTNEQKEAADDAKDLLKKNQTMDMPDYVYHLKTKSIKNELKDFYLNPGVDIDVDSVDGVNSTTGSLESYLTYYKKYQDLLIKAQEKAGKATTDKARKNAESDIENLEKAIDSMDEELQSKAADLGDALNGLSVNGEGLVAITGYEKEFEEARRMLSLISDKNLTEAQKALNSLNDFFDGSFGKNALKAELKESAGSADELQKALAGMGLTLDDLGIDNIADLQSYLQDAASSAEDAADAINTVEGTFSSVKLAFDQDNQDASWKTMAEYLAQADELYAAGQIGIDDFKEAAQFVTAKKINPDDGFVYDAQAYEKAWTDAQDKVKKYFDQEDQFASTENFLKDLQNVGLALKDDTGFTWTDNFKSSADAADKLGLSVSAVEVLMHNLEAYGAEFDGVVWSGDELEKYKSALEGIKTIYESMEEGSTKDRYGKLIEGWDQELAGYENDLSTLTSQDVVVKIQFQYSLASIQQQIDNLQSQADEGGDNQTWAELNSSKRQYLKQAEQAPTSDVKNLDIYKEADSYLEELRSKLANETDQSAKNAIQRQISDVYDAMKYMNDAFIDSGKQWSEYYQSDQYKKDYTEFGNRLNNTDINAKLKVDTTEADDAVKKEKDKIEKDEKPKIEVDGDTTNFTEKLTNAQNAIRNFVGKNGQLDLSIPGAQQTFDQLKQLEIQQQQIINDSSRLDSNAFTHLPNDVDESVKKLQEFQNAVDELGALNNIKDSDVNIDTTDAENKVKNLFNQIKNQPFVQKMQLDTKDWSSFEKSLSKLSGEDIKLKLGVDDKSITQQIQNALKPDMVFSMESVKQQLNLLPEGQEITFTANMDNVTTQLNAVKNEDGSVDFTANTGDVEQKIDIYKNEDGSISFVPDTSMVEDEIQNLSKGETISFYANIDGLMQEVTAYKDLDGSISYKVKDQEHPLPEDADLSYILAHQDDPQNRGAQVYYKYAGQDAPGSRTASVYYQVSGGGKVALTQAGSMKPMYNGTANASGDWSVSKSEPSLVGELGSEIIVRNGRFFTVGDNGAEFVNVKRGDIIFNHKQSEELLKNGYVTSNGGRGKLQGGANAFGTANAAGTPFGKHTGVLTSQKTKKESSSNKSSSSKSSSGSGSGSSGTSNSSSSSKSSSGGSSGSSSSGSSSDKSTTEEVVDYIKILLSRLSRLSELASDAIDRAVGLVAKENQAADAISKLQNERAHNQKAAEMYLEKANSIGLSDAYKDQIARGSFNIETIRDEDLKKKISDYQSYYESYLDASSNVLKLDDKIADLAEKRLEIIEKEYDAIVDINDSIKDVADSKMSLNDALGVAIDNPDNYANINKSIKAQEDTYNQLTQKLNEYQKEINSQLSSGLLKKGSDAYQSAMKNIQDFTAKIYDASTSLIELQNKLDQIKIDTIQNVIDGFKRNSDVIDKYISLLESQDRTPTEDLYTDRIDNNNAQVQQNLAQMEIYRKKQATLDVNSKSYQDYAEKIQSLKEDTLDLISDNEALKDSIFELRFKNLDEGIQKYADLEDELKSFRDLLNDDAFLDKHGRVTEDGLAQIALLQQSIGTSKQKIADYTTGLQKLKESYDNGVISLTEYNDKSKDYREGIQNSIADVKSYNDSLIDLYKNSMSTEIDYLNKIISKHKEALQKKADYYDYDKTISKKSNDINAIKAQIMALQGVNYLLL